MFPSAKFAGKYKQNVYVLQILDAVVIQVPRVAPIAEPLTVLAAKVADAAAVPGMHRGVLYVLVQ